MEVWKTYVRPAFGTYVWYHGQQDTFLWKYFKVLLLDKKKFMNESCVHYVYGNASYASVGKDQCYEIIFDYHSNYMKIIRKINSFTSSQENQHKIKKNQRTRKPVLRFFSARNCIKFEKCSCPKIKKVLIPEQNFVK